MFILTQNFENYLLKDVKNSTNHSKGLLVAAQVPEATFIKM